MFDEINTVIAFYGKLEVYFHAFLWSVCHCHAHIRLTDMCYAKLKTAIVTVILENTKFILYKQNGMNFM